MPWQSGGGGERQVARCYMPEAGEGIGGRQSRLEASAMRALPRCPGMLRRRGEGGEEPAGMMPARPPRGCHSARRPPASSVAARCPPPSREKYAAGRGMHMFIPMYRGGYEAERGER